MVGPAAGASLFGRLATGPLRAGQLYETEFLAARSLDKNTLVFRPEAWETETAAFKAVVGEARYTSGGQLRGTIFDVTTNGLQEIKSGSSMLNSTYQLRLQTYYSVTRGESFTLQTTRPVNPTLQNTLDFWGVNVVKPPR
jgi:hypothetical protein